jgi:hypothetical protein
MLTFYPDTKAAIRTTDERARAVVADVTRPVQPAVVVSMVVLFPKASTVVAFPSYSI